MVLEEAAVEVEHYDVLELAHGVEDLIDSCHWCGHVLYELVHRAKVNEQSDVFFGEEMLWFVLCLLLSREEGWTDALN